MTAYRDKVTVLRDSSNEGDPDPTFGTVLAADVPCKIQMVKGDETYRGRQLEAQVDYVVEFWHSATLQQVTALDRLQVQTGLFAGKRLNIAWARTHQMQMGKPPIMEIFCRESAA